MMAGIFETSLLDPIGALGGLSGFGNLGRARSGSAAPITTLPVPAQTGAGTTWAGMGFRSRAAWIEAGRPTPGGYSRGNPVSTGGGGGTTFTVPTTEPNQCPPGMTYSPPPPGSGTGTCTGPQQVGGDGSSAASSGGGITDFLSQIPGIVWLGLGALVIFSVLKK